MIELIDFVSTNSSMSSAFVVFVTRAVNFFFENPGKYLIRKLIKTLQAIRVNQLLITQAINFK